MRLNLTDEEVQALIRMVRRAIDADRYSMAPRLDPLKAVLARLDPPKPAEPLPASLRGVQGCGAEPRRSAAMNMRLRRIKTRKAAFGG